MSRDFTLEKYSELCKTAFESGYTIMPVLDYLQYSPLKGNILVIRHDVDRMMGRALQMADLEKKLGIRTTYYFRKSGFSKPHIIKEIAEMGHEIGYHYEVLDEAKGNTELAFELFKQRLETLREIAPVDTICMHGNPLTKWVNLDLWKSYDCHDLSLKGEAFLSIKDAFYFSDTGRIWDMSRKVKDMLPEPLLEQIKNKDKIQTTNDLIGFFERKRFPRVYLCIHPERWSHSYSDWLIDYNKDLISNIIKKTIKITTVRIMPKTT